MTQAWILDFGGGLLGAVGEREQQHLVYEARPIEIALAPAHCAHVLVWERQPVAVLDVGRWAGQAATRNEKGILGLYRYLDPRGHGVCRGALWLASAPRRLHVRDEDAMDPPAQPGALATLALAWFGCGDARSVAVLDLARLFESSADARPAALPQEPLARIAAP